MNLLTRLEDSLPIELWQRICEFSITPSQPTEPGGLGYIVDPHAAIEFRKQRDNFRKELEHLKVLEEHITLGEHASGLGEIEYIEREWRGAWETNMSNLIYQDTKEWERILQKGPWIESQMFQRAFSIHDVYAHVENYVEENWVRCLWATSAGEDRRRREVLDDIMQSLRIARAFWVCDGHGSNIGEAMQCPRVKKEVNARLHRSEEVDEAERLDRYGNGASVLDWMPGPQKAIRWENTN